MPNSKYIIKPNYKTWTGEPTKELVGKMKTARNLFFKHLCSFCNQYRFDINDIAQTERVFLIGSQAREDYSEDSDLDLAIVNSAARISDLHSYKHQVLDPELNRGKEKKDWIDIYFIKDEGEVLTPRWDVTDYWGY
jgi:hypothetical protein